MNENLNAMNEISEKLKKMRDEIMAIELNFPEDESVTNELERDELEENATAENTIDKPSIRSTDGKTEL